MELRTKSNRDIQSDMLETMMILKADMESLKSYNLKLMNAKSYQEEINELILKRLMEPQKNNGQNSCSIGKKRKGVVHDASSEETTEKIPKDIQDLRKDKEIKFGKHKEHPIEMQGEFKKLRLTTFDGESEEKNEAWLLNIKRYFQVYRYDNNLRERLAIFQMSEKDALWWKEDKSVHTIHSKDLS